LFGVIIVLSTSDQYGSIPKTNCVVHNDAEEMNSRYEYPQYGAFFDALRPIGESLLKPVSFVKLAT
jgi:hypothetical protein